MRRMSTATGVLLPTRKIRPPWMAVSSFDCRWGGRLPISSRKSVPWSATSNFPARSARASVKAPLTWPNSSLSKSVSGTAPISTETISSPLRAERLCISRASISLPVPFSPVIRMLASVAATFSTISRMRAMAGLSPQNIGCSEASSRLISLSCFTSRADRARLYALRSEATNRSLSHGLTTKSTAPSRIALTARSISAYAVKSTTLISGLRAWISLSQ